MAQFSLGFRQGDVQRPLASLGPSLEKMQGYGGFTGAWLTLKQEQMATGQPTGKDVIQPFDTGCRFCCEQLFDVDKECPRVTCK